MKERRERLRGLEVRVLELVSWWMNVISYPSLEGKSEVVKERGKLTGERKVLPYHFTPSQPDRTDTHTEQQ